MKTALTFLLSALLGLLSILINAQVTNEDLHKLGIDTTQVIPEGLARGAYAPIFEGTDALGNDFSLKRALEDGPVVVAFFRGEWCPHCTKYMQQLEDSLSHINEKGAQVVAITPEQNSHVIEMVAETRAEFRVLSDNDGSIMRDYEVAFPVTKRYQKRIKRLLRAKIAERNGQEEATLPVPAVYLITPSGKVAWRYFNYDYRQRPPVSEILKAIDALK
jgi:peroxiredoxin